MTSTRMLRMITVLILVSSGYASKLPPKNDSEKSQIVTTSAYDVKKTLNDTQDMMTTGSPDQADEKTEEGKEETYNMPDLASIMMECNNTYHIDMSYLESLNASGSFPDELDRTPKCYVRCYLEKTGVASEDGQYDPEQAAVIFAGQRGGQTMNDIEDMAAECAVDRKESCKCDRAYKFLRCLMESEIKR